MSLLGVKWSMTSAILPLSKTSVNPAFSNSLIATGVVMSLPMTRSSFASISSPAFTDCLPACAARIFCVIVMPIQSASFGANYLSSLLIPFRYARMLASTTSTDRPRPLAVRPFSSSFTVTSPCASSPPVTACSS